MFLHRRVLLALAATAALTAGCAGFNTVSVDVASFGDWPAGRAPGRYAFDRLPSQQTQADDAQALETAAQAALAAAGFQRAADGESADVLVQLGARVSRTGRSPWDDPLWWRGGWVRWYPRPSPLGGWSAWRWQSEPQRYEREVALLLRDRVSGQALYEVRGSTDGITGGSATLFDAMFRAALQDFPRTQTAPHTVTVPFTASTSPAK